MIFELSKEGICFSPLLMISWDRLFTWNEFIKENTLWRKIINNIYKIPRRW